MPRFSLPISCAALARWLKRSTSLRSSSSIWRRQSAISIKAVVSLRALAKTVSPIFAAKTSAFQACNTKQMDSRADSRRPTADDSVDPFCHSFSFFAGIPFDGLHNGAAYDSGIGEFPHRSELLRDGNPESYSYRKLGRFAESFNK